MGNLVSYGQIAAQYAKSVYKQQRAIVDGLVATGKISKRVADQKWAQGVYKELTKHGLKVSKEILKLLK